MIKKEQIEGAWHELRGKIKFHWAELTDDEIAQTKGNFEELSGAIQRKYGWTKEEADREIEHFLDSQE